MVSFAIVSYDIRRDLHDPLRFFEVLKPLHLYHKSSYLDMAPSERQDADSFRSPLDLLRRLRRARPQIIQGAEPFVRRLIPYDWAVLAYAKRTRTPYVVPSLDNLPVAGKYGAAWASLVRASAGPYVRGANLAVAVNEGAERNLLWAGARREKTARMMYGTWGVDTTEFTPEGPRRKVGGADKSIVFLGRLERAKGVFDLVNAMPLVLRHARAGLTVIGDGPDKEELRAAAQAAGVGSSTEFVGAVMNRDVPSYLRAATVLAAPSKTTRKWAEQVGMGAIQALACGVPVVSTFSGSIPEFVDDGVTGLLVREGDVPGLASALVRLLTDDETHARLSRSARAEALRRFDARANVRAVEQRILSSCGFQ
ncbi:MAG TPA: glycosyltransferase family 4 protein [Candidatus Dormibacteraeota bacterium]|nr:glycosyltransferase family 4 protein [Candidatus Dormibacteraeota bacterium]